MPNTAEPKPYKSAPRFKLALTILFVLIMLANVSSIITMVAGIFISAASELNKAGSADDLDFDSIVALIGVIDIVLSIVTGFVFIPWFTRMRQNAEALGIQGLKCTVSDCIGAFLIPFINLFKPYQISQELWKASAEDALPPSQTWQNAKASTMIKLWWFFWLTTCIAGRITNALAKGLKPDANPDMALILCAVYIITDASSCVAAALVLTFVRKLTQRQEAQHALVNHVASPNVIS